jgi:phospholipid/cholesterol/gamma-HCH transport system permease protein
MKSLGEYMIFMGNTITNMERWRVYINLFFIEAVKVGFNSLFIVSIVSTFIGAVIAVQVSYNLSNPLYPMHLVGFISREMILLEIAPTLTAIVFAGKVGSNIAGELGTMKITEQVDALEVMGVNATSYLVLPKVLASTLMYPLLVILAATLGLTGGYIAGALGNLFTPQEYLQGLRMEFLPYNVLFMVIKAVIFGFLISSISAYKGFFVRGGALEVGAASTSAVTSSCIAVLCADLVLASTLVA